MLTAVTKFVDSPVEDSVPALAGVRYRGHSYVNTDDVSVVDASISSLTALVSGVTRTCDFHSAILCITLKLLKIVLK